jgi:2-polyprenyl-3-methyl-5-hydroxy-6-metoxy-1,4-benzoquinol methylase
VPEVGHARVTRVIAATVTPVGDGRDQGPAANLAWWQEAAPLHAGSEFYDLEGLRSGRDVMRPHEVVEIGEVSGRDLVHLQCHIGTDTLSWARRGARTVGLDFSSNAIDAAGRLAVGSGVDIEFVRADVYDAPEALGHRRFDIVYTGIGALNWLADLPGWAQVVEQLLRPGGTLYLSEIHPLVLALSEDGRTLARDLLHTGYQESTTPGGTYAVPDAAMVNRVTFERVPGIGEVLTAILDAGFSVEHFGEQHYTNAPWPWTVRGDDGFFRLPECCSRYPLTYSLRARKPG